MLHISRLAGCCGTWPARRLLFYMLEDYSICANSCLGGMCYKLKHIQYQTPYVGTQISHSSMLHVLDAPNYYCSPAVGEDAIYEGKKKFRFDTHILHVRDIRIFIPEYKYAIPAMETWRRRAARTAGKKPAIFIHEHNFYKDLGSNTPYNIEVFLSSKTFINTFNACPVREKFVLCTREKTITTLKRYIDPSCVIDCTAHSYITKYIGWSHKNDDVFVARMDNFLL